MEKKKRYRENKKKCVFFLLFQIFQNGSKEIRLINPNWSIKQKFHQLLDQPTPTELKRLHPPLNCCQFGLFADVVLMLFRGWISFKLVTTLLNKKLKY